jgi:type 1 glutamine amidotransferase
MRRLLTIIFILVCCVAPAHAKPHRVLIYTHNGKGYVHQNIQASVDAMTAIAKHHGFQVDVSDDPAVFTTPNLKRYAVLVFSNTNNQAFTTPAQREAFQHFIQSGGGLMGIHSAAGSERDWPYFTHVMGGKFVEHPPQQILSISLAEPTSKITAGLPQTFDWDDECYFYTDRSPDAHILLTVDRSKLQGVDKMKLAHPDEYPALLPVAWYQSVDGGREFYLGIGHRPESYKDPKLVQLLDQGFVWVAKAKQ